MDSKYEKIDCLTSTNKADFEAKGFKIIATTRCPKCKRIVYSNCESCVSFCIVVHHHPDNDGYDGTPDVEEAKWVRLDG